MKGILWYVTRKLEGIFDGILMESYYKKAGVCLCVCLSQRNLFVCPRLRGTQLHPATILEYLLEYLLLYFVHDLLGLSLICFLI